MTVERSSMNDYAALSVDELAVAAKTAKGGSWLVALATLMGKIADKMGENLVKMAQKIDSEQAKASDAAPGEKNDLTALNGQMNAYGQLMNMFMQSMSAIIKTIGEGNAQIARKN